MKPKRDASFTSNGEHLGDEADDLKGYRDTSPHNRMLALVRERVGHGRVLVECFLRAGALEAANDLQPPQGDVISPLRWIERQVI